MRAMAEEREGGLEARIGAVRTEVVAAARRMLQSGLVVSAWGNVSARVPGEADLFLITPSGVEYEALSEETLCLVDVGTGATIGETLRPSTEMPMHLAVYRARPDVGGIVHTHSLHASAHSVVRRPIPPIVEDLAQVVGGAVECAEYAPAGTRDLGECVVRALASRAAVLMANHGMVGVGTSVGEALRVCLVVEKCAQIHSLAQALGTPVILSRQEVERLQRAYLTSYGQRPPS